LWRRRGLGFAVNKYLDLLYFKAYGRIFKTTRLVEEYLFGDQPAQIDPKVPIYFTQSVNRPESVEEIRRLRPDIIVVNGTSIIKKPIIDIPPYGILNIHTGICPQYRGCTPEFWALYSDEPEGIGVTIHFLTENIDAGDIILQEPLQADPFDDDQILRCKNAMLGSKLLVKAIRQIESCTIQPIPQDLSTGNYYSHRTWRQDLALRRRLKKRKRRLLEKARLANTR